MSVPSTVKLSETTPADGPEASPAWHALSVDAVGTRVGVDPLRGLDHDDAARRLADAGPNELQDRPRRGVTAIFLGQFRDFMVIVLLAAAAVSGMIGDVGEAMGILAIVLLNAVLGAIPEYRADRAIEALRRMSAPQATTLRGGRWCAVPSPELVRGDIVQVEAGSVMPADLRLFEAQALETDESTLSGESVPVTKDSAVLDDASLAFFDRRNIAFRGSSVTHGRGRGIVIATGMLTETGRIAHLLGSVRATPLQRRLARFGRRLSVAILILCGVIFLAGLARGEPAGLMFLTAIALAVAAIPEALPAVVTIGLALGAKRMVALNALLRRLPAAEALGSVTYICTDKTGTLTLNRMHVEEMYRVGRDWTAELPGPESPGGDETAPILGLALALCNDTVASDDGYAGDPTEVALVEAAARFGYERATLDRRYPRIAELPFDSERKSMSTVHAMPDHGTMVLVKGAPERLLTCCDRQLGSHGEEPLDRERVLAEVARQAGEGRRVLAFAYRRLEARPDSLSADTVERELILVGLAALIDPPRPEARRSVELCRSAGIRPLMITGDHPATAAAIARRLGISPSHGAGGLAPEVLSGVDLTELAPGELEQRVSELSVFARVTPEQKIDIVQALQNRGELVAMTGDGVNDAPALRRADIGVAMGQKGTDVAREAADMVLLDDNFATIVSAVREGRRIFDNIRKFIRYTLTSNAGEIWTLFLAPFLGLPLPLLPVQILWINLVTDGLPGLALAVEPEERGLMARPPRSPDEAVFSHDMWRHVLLMGLLIGGLSLGAMWWSYHRGSENWRSVVFTVLTFCQLAQAMALRSERDSLFTQGVRSNLPLLGAVLLTVVLQLAVVYLPPLQVLFSTTGLTATELAVCCLVPAVVFAAVEAEKWSLRRHLPPCPSRQR